MDLDGTDGKSPMPSQDADRAPCAKTSSSASLQPQSMNSPWVAECVGFRHMGHWRICWHRCRSKSHGHEASTPHQDGAHGKWGSRCECLQVRPPRQCILQPPTWLSGQGTSQTPQPGNPNSAICSLNFCATSSWPPCLLSKASMLTCREQER